MGTLNDWTMAMLRTLSTRRAKDATLARPLVASARKLTMPATAERAQSTRPREFSIIAGAHRGATFALGEDLLIIGADESCDICLSDAGVAPRHVALAQQGDGVSIRSLDGPVSVSNQPLTPSKQILLQAGAEITLGASEVRLRFTSADPHSEPQQPPSPSRLVSHKPRLIAASVLLVAGVIAAGLSARPLDASRSSPPDAPTPASVRALLQREHLDHQVSLATTDYGIELSGVVSTEAAAQLRAVLADVPVSNSVISDAELIEQVRDVFRTHGYEADVSYLGQGRARVANLDEANERVQRATARARADISLLKSLTFAMIGTDQPPDKPAPYADSSRIRFTAHVDGSTAYLAGASGARYFVGSVLPDGHTVKRITDRAVLVDREGQLSWVGF